MRGAGIEFRTLKLLIFSENSPGITVLNRQHQLHEPLFCLDTCNAEAVHTQPLPWAHLLEVDKKA